MATKTKIAHHTEHFFAAISSMKKSIRLKNYDYSSNGVYFITFCTKNRVPYFGKIIGGQMFLSEMGLIVKNFIEEIRKHFPFAELGEYIVMPDHVHFILVINKGLYNSNRWIVRESFTDVQPGGRGGRKAEWKPGSVGVILNQLKRICTIHCRKIDKSFSWQTRFYDHIIRDQRAFRNISRYIASNPGADRSGMPG
jgi:putative transposase